VQTLFAAGIPAIGISGKKSWNPKFADLPLIKCVKEVVIVQEPDAEDFAKAVMSGRVTAPLHERHVAARSLH
jgi:hypothetical protein